MNTYIYIYGTFSFVDCPGVGAKTGTGWFHMMAATLHAAVADGAAMAATIAAAECKYMYTYQNLRPAPNSNSTVRSTVE